eukprot:CAMPEP_0201904362 /NCGR_PEP_ID=MMETSP0902-20130614/55958_1 /ASSEMBLY_ACC=CAM_ASM_000551 /TAXON_ID=420261 /ORGANISM="Thalassiosira antarctica, Strain CCMP982" /LENGTH=143 /DNA_ID=CAMNT_0048438447 /DNA_START=88 /DNA_END=519 /DNA_ORIENTATION=+
MNKMIAPGTYYVSVTGLLTKSWFSMPKFFYLSNRAYNEALKTKGNISSSMFSTGGIYHTITVWESKDAMRDFFSGEDHINAMKSLKDVSSYVKVHGYFTDELPTATCAINEWKEEGRRVYGEPNEKCGDLAPKACLPCTEFEQ